MSLTVENLEKNMAKLTITVPADEFVEAMKASYNKQKGCDQAGLLKAEKEY